MQLIIASRNKLKTELMLKIKYTIKQCIIILHIRGTVSVFTTAEIKFYFHVIKH